LDFNFNYDSLDFSVEGRVRFDILLLRPTLRFSGKGELYQDSSGVSTSSVSVKDSSFSVLYLPFRIRDSDEIAEEIIEAILKVLNPADMVERDYYLAFKEDELFFVIKRLMDQIPSEDQIIEMIKEEKILEKSTERGLKDQRVYGGRVLFKDNLARNVVIYSNDWWANLKIYWKETNGKSFPEKVRGDGFYRRDLDIKIDIFNHTPSN